MARDEGVKINRRFCLWIGLALGILTLSFHGISGTSPLVAIYDSNRWVHFLAYGVLSAVPVALWNRGSSIMLSLIPGMVSIAVESFQSDPSWLIARPQITPANLFGVAAGILFGLNLRALSRARKPAESLGSNINGVPSIQYPQGMQDRKAGGSVRHADEKRAVNV